MGESEPFNTDGNLEYGSIEDKKETKSNEDKDETQHLTQNIRNKDNGETSRNETVSLKQKYFAMSMYILALIAQCASIASTQVLGGAIPMMELNMWRYLAQTSIVLPVNLIRRKCDFKIPRSKLLLASAMVFLSNVKNITTFTAYIYLPVGVGFSMHVSITLALTAVISIFIKQDCSVELFVSSLMAIVGIQMMTQPELLFPQGLFPPPPVINYTSPCSSSCSNTGENVNISSSSIDSNISMNSSWLGYILMSVASVAHVCGLYGLRTLMSSGDVTMLALAFWVGCTGSAVSAAVSAAVEVPVLPSHSAYCMLMLAVHCFGTSHQSIILPWTLKYLNPSVSTVAKAGSVVLLMVLQYTVLSEIHPGKRNWLEVVGAATVSVACCIGPVVHVVRDYLMPKIRLKDYCNLELDTK